jgi:hypothetical protein
MKRRTWVLVSAARPSNPCAVGCVENSVSVDLDRRAARRRSGDARRPHDRVRRMRQDDDAALES